MQRDADVIIVGAGFAGAAAACTLARRGFRPLVVEARDRAGGRAYSRPFPGDAEVLEFGGSWITPWQRRIRRHAEEHAIALRPRSDETARRWHDGRALSADTPAAPDEAAAYAATMARISEDALRYAEGERTGRDGGSLLSVSLSEYLRRIGAGPAARSQVMAWWMVSGNGDPAVVSAGEFISSCAYGGGLPEGMLDKLRHTLVPGARMLVERMLAASGAPLHLGFRAARIHAHGNGVTVEATDGRRLAARHAVVAVPLNTIAGIAFEPPLSASKARAAARRHAGASVKVWIKARGVEVGAFATGGTGGLPWMFCERRAADGAAYLVGFGLAGQGFDAGLEEHVRRALAALFPEAEFLAWDWHDWVGDPDARGTWVALPADALDIADPEVWNAEGRCAFAGSDIAHEEPGWFEAAIASGERAAEQVAERLAEERVS